MSQPRSSSDRPSLKGALIALCIGFFVTLIAAEFALRVVYPQWHEFDSGRFMIREFVPGYGDVYLGRPGFDGYFSQNNGDFRAHIRINAAGLRNVDPVAEADGRVWVIGDSMAFGWGVELQETYTNVIARRSGRPTYNIASPGTDVCGYQALAARMPKGLRPAGVIVGLIVENDIKSYHCAHGKGPTVAPPTPPSGGAIPSLLDIKVYLTGESALYNFVATASKRVGSVTNLLADVGLIARPHAYRADFNLADPAGRAASTVAELVYLRQMFPPGTPFAVLVCPARFDIRDDDPFFAGLRKSLVAGITDRGIDVIDATTALKKVGFKAAHFAHDGHWSAKGHAAVGRQVADWVRRKVKSFVPAPGG